MYLNWSRFRDDGIAILPNSNSVQAFEQHLQNLHPPDIKWVVSHGKEAEYLDLKLSMDNGYIKTDVFSKNSHSYLPPHSCHAPSVFKGLISGVGIRLRMLCSDDDTLEERVDEYAKYFCLSGWKYKKAKQELKKGASKNRKKLIQQSRKKKKKKIAWVTNYDPRVPSKSKIMRKHMGILYSNKKNQQIFPKGMIISADRRLQNIGEIYKPTVPKRLVEYGPNKKQGFFPCSSKRCDTCSHSTEINEFTSAWDQRKWKIRGHLSCSTPNVVYVIRCKIHNDAYYVGSTKNLKLRWANHKSDTNLKKTTKCTVAQHVHAKDHPNDSKLSFLQIFAVETVTHEKDLLKKETWWQCNLGAIFNGLNLRKDVHKVSKLTKRTTFSI
eukprot:TRINITY_DN46767_c1_g1_i5.p1 TRINITY_DN46767_c1_g1~~TRINITY_DN46767_c1_g1_i5.p1  ORF type:complete len:381 (-),score=50.73 TRINITY_DN46767_c1_g1_i5:160-1302(-)